MPHCRNAEQRQLQIIKVKYRSSLFSMADDLAARAVIYTMGFEHDMVQNALAQAGGNEQLAIDLILNGEVHEAVTASTFVDSVPSPAVSVIGPTFGFETAFAPAEVAFYSDSMTWLGPDGPLFVPGLYDLPDCDWSRRFANVLSFPDHLIDRRLSFNCTANGKLQSPKELYAHIKRPLELMQAAAWFFARQSPGMKRHREEPPPPLGHMLTQFSPRVPLRVMCGCVATACRRLATAPAGVHVIYRTTGRWASWIMERVTRGRVKKVQVRLQQRACCAVRCACRASACVCCMCDACCSKRWLIFRSVAAHRRVCIMRAVAFIPVCRLLPPPVLPADGSHATFWTRQETETAFRCFAI
jgi:hypothetical protein